METEYDKELLLFIKNEGLTNLISINEQAYETIKQIEETFVMGFSGIDWDSCEIIYSKKLESGFSKYLDETKISLVTIGKLFPHLLKELVCVVGDSLTNLSYEMAFEDFLNVSNQFLSIPQHTYIWFKTSRRCINFSFENEVFFG